MTYNQIVRYYGSLAKAAAALKLSKTTVHSWKRRESIPWARQFDIEMATGHKLRAEARNG